MKVLMLKDFSEVGRRNELKEVNDGYAKNFLIPKGYAVPATPATISKLRNEEKQRREKQQRAEEHNRQLKNELEKRTFTLAVRVGDKSQVYGSVREADIAKRIFEKMNVEIDKRQITVPKGIKALGEYTVEIKLGSITARPKIQLIDTNEEKEE